MNGRSIRLFLALAFGIFALMTSPPTFAADKIVLGVPTSLTFLEGEEASRRCSSPFRKSTPRAA